MDITKENIEKYLLDKNKNPSRLKKKQNAEFFQRVLAVNPHEDENTSLYLTYHGVECRRCQLCGKSMKINNFQIGWKETAHWCSLKCRDADPLYHEHYKKAIGRVDQSSRVEKMRETVKERYGVDHIAKTDYFKTRMKEFHESVDHAPMREKYKATCMERYGVEHYYQSDELKEKNARYRNDPEYQKARVEKMRETNRALYGVENYSQTEEYKKRWKEEISKKVKDTCLERYGAPWFLESDKFKKWLSNNDGMITAPEYAIHGLIAELGLIAQAHNRTVLPSGKEIDVWVGEKRVGFEVNGVYWHSSWDHESDKVAKKRHLEKSNWAKEAGIRLVHFTDIEIETKWPIVSSMIKSILGKTDRRIYARKCEVKVIDYQTGHGFLNETHIQGGAPCAIWIGLYHEDELVSVMGFNKARFDKNYEWELVRFASALNTTVVGGFSKCLKRFRKLHSGSVVSYADYSRSNGDVYRNIGFVEKGLSHPSYRWVKGDQLYNRHSFMRRNLARMIGEENYNPEETEAENCWRNGYRRIWDCGQIKFVLE